MHLLRKRVVGGLTLAAVSSALLFAAIAPASAKIVKPPSSALITISAPTRAQKVLGHHQPIDVRSTYPGTQAVWITFYKGQVPVQTVAGVQDLGDATLYRYDWDTLMWPQTSATISASAINNGVEIAVAKTRIPVKIVNPIFSGPASTTAGKTVRFGGKFLPAAETAHLYQCWAEVDSPADIATSCDTDHVTDVQYSKTTVSIPVKMIKGTDPNLINRVVLSITDGSSNVVVLKALAVTVK